jgi:hypothetical protein
MRRTGRTVRDPALGGEVVGREAREGEFEISGEKRGDWTDGELIIPSTAKAQQIHSALKNALIKQLEAEAATLGDPDAVAIHGKTGISTLEDQIAINLAEPQG